MNETVSRRLLAGLAGLALLVGGSLLASCSTEDETPPGPQILNLSLAESLSRYDSVKIVLLDMKDTSQILETVYSGHLSDPTHIPPDTLDSAKDKPFVVRITGYAADDQIALQTLIYYDGGKKTVVHVPLPQVIPKRWITRFTASAGSLTPQWDQETTDYELALPEGVTSLTLDVVAAHSNAVLVVAGDTIRRGMPPKSFSVGADTSIVPITVSELGVSRAYKVVMIPHKQVELALARIEVVPPGQLDPEFDQWTNEYGLDVLNGADSCYLRAYPSDPIHMTMFLMEDDGSSRKLYNDSVLVRIADSTNAEHHFRIGVVRSTDTAYYNLYMAHR